MGSFYTNIVLNGADRQSTVELLRRLEREAFVAALKDDLTAVYDAEAEGQNPQVLAELAGRLSRELDCVAWAVLNHDDDILWYRLYAGGEMADEYDSAPGYLDPGGPSAPAGGDAGELAQAFGRPEAARVIEPVLRRPLFAGGVAFTALERHRRLAEALGLRFDLLALGFDYIEAGDADEFDPGTFVDTAEGT